MESDERFKDLIKDPRFRTLRKKRTKIKIDDRFKCMFNDEKFAVKKRDKRGHKLKEPSRDNLKKYYSIEDGETDEEDEEKAVHEDESEVRNEDATDSDKSEVEESDEDDLEPEQEIQETESDVSSSSDEDEDSELEDLNPEKIQYDWQPLDADAETCEASTRRLAIQNLDWDHLDVRDIFTLLNSVRPPLSVKVFVSEFGKSRLKDEELEGPKEFKELSQIDSVEEEYTSLKEKMKQLDRRHLETCRVNEYEDADEAMNLKDEKVRELVRRYQLNRMRYFYAVAEFDSSESAEQVYKELDGMEYEGSSMELDLRFIPDSVQFDDEDLKAECNKLPDLTTYKVPQFINSALQQTTVKFTWDETDSKRQEKLRRAFTKEELERDDLDAYLATDTDSEDFEQDDCEDSDSCAADAVSVVTANSEARANKYKLLLQSLEEEEAAKKKVDVDVEWGDFSGDDDKEENHEQECKSISDESVQSHSGLSKKRNKRKSKRKRNEKEKNADGADEELDLLMMDSGENNVGEFKFDANDPRFKAVYDSGSYNIDPSHPNFKRTEAFNLIAENKRARRQKTSS